MKRKLIAAAVLGGLTLPCSVLAYNSPTGGYMGAGIGQSYFKIEGGISGSSVEFEESDFAYKAYSGYRFTPGVGVEMAYADLGSPEGDVEVDGTASGAHGKLDASAFMAYLVGYATQGRYDWFGKIGMADWNAISKVGGIEMAEDGTDLALGLGFQYRGDDGLNFRGELESVQVDDEGEGISEITDFLATVSINYQF